MVRKRCVRGSIFPLPKGHVWRLTFVSCCRRRPIGRREFDLSMSDGIPSFRGGNSPPRPPPQGGHTRVGFSSPLPLGEGARHQGQYHASKNLPLDPKSV